MTHSSHKYPKHLNIFRDDTFVHHAILKRILKLGQHDRVIDHLQKLRIGAQKGRELLCPLRPCYRFKATRRMLGRKSARGLPLAGRELHGSPAGARCMSSQSTGPRGRVSETADFTAGWKNGPRVTPLVWTIAMGGTNTLMIHNT